MSQTALNRRAYPGGRDDSDLTVQPLKKIERKDQEEDVEQYESGTTDFEGTDQGFGD